MSDKSLVSSDLHAFPDHDVMRACLEGIDERVVTREDAVAAIRSDAGWIPVGVEPTKGLIYFANVGRHDLDRWQFVYSVHALATETPDIECFSVGIDILDQIEFDELAGQNLTNP